MGVQRSRLGVVRHHACGSAEGEADVRPEAEGPALGFVHRGVREIDLGGSTAWVDPTQVVLRGGRPLRIRRHRCSRSVCVTTVGLSREGVDELSRRSGVARESLRRLFDDRLVPRGAPIQRQLHLLIAGSAAGNGQGPATVHEGILDLFDEGIALASAPRGAAGGHGRAARAVRRARRILAADLETPPSLDELAAAVACGRSYFCRIFKAETGMTMLDYLHRLRLNEAIVELQLGAADLSSLAFRLGYSSHSHFTNRFRRFFGVPPSTFRDQIRRKARGSGQSAVAILKGPWRPKTGSAPRSAACCWNGTPATRRRSPSSSPW